MDGCFILFGDAVVFLQISFGASEARQGHRLSVRELGFVVFQGRATQYLPFSYSRESFSLSSSVSTSLSSRSVPDFSIS